MFQALVETNSNGSIEYQQDWEIGAQVTIVPFGIRAHRHFLTFLGPSVQILTEPPSPFSLGNPSTPCKNRRCLCREPR